jgi:carbonic anhydrase
MKMNGDEALRRLLAGNERFQRGEPEHPRQDGRRRRELLAGQHPFAAILGCADSRISPEILFDQGLGDLFVIRTAGNTLSREGLASIEYALAHLDTPLVVVLGHSHCGAVTAALAGGEPASPALAELTATLHRSFRDALQDPGPQNLKAEEANLASVVAQLRTAEPVVAPRVRQGRARVVGMHYRQEDGSVVVTVE